MKYQFEREEDLLAQQLNDGLITSKEYNEAIRELYRDYRMAMEEAAQRAADAENFIEIIEWLWKKPRNVPQTKKESDGKP